MKGVTAMSKQCNKQGRPPITVEHVLQSPESLCLFLEYGSYISGGITLLMSSDGFRPLWSLETTKQLA